MPWLVEKFGFTAKQTLPQPLVGCLVQDGNSIEELDRVLWKRIYVLGQQMQQSRRDRCERESEDGAAHGSMVKRVGCRAGREGIDLRDSGDRGRTI